MVPRSASYTNLLPLVRLRAGGVLRRGGRHPSRMALRASALSLISVFICVCLSGCYIAPYDAATDQALSDIQRKVDGHLVDLQAGAATTQPTTRPSPFVYGPLRLEIHSLSIRLNAREQGDPSIDKENQALGEILSQVDDIQRLESIATTQPIVPGAWNVAQEEFDQGIGAVLGLELKRK